MPDLKHKIANADGLEQAARKSAAAYRASGSPKMAAHHDMKADEWAAIAGVLREQLRYEEEAALDAAAAEGAAVQARQGCINTARAVRRELPAA